MGGLCQLVDGMCKAATNADCAQSTVCKVLGRCTARLLPGDGTDGGYCVIGKDEDCAQSSGCRTEGWCWHSEQICLECPHRARCEDGACIGFCVAKSEADCVKAEKCIKLGPCEYKSGRCRLPEKKWAP